VRHVEVEPARLARARWGVIVMFFGSGMMAATFASRLVVVRQSLGVSPAHMGLLLLVIAVGSVTLMPVTGHLIERFDEVRLLRVCAAIACSATVASAYCAVNGWALAMVLPLFCQGATVGAWDVAMNVAGSRVEQGLGRSIMPQFHAGFSLATLVGAGVGWTFSHLGAPLLLHITLVAGVTLAGVLYCATWLLPPTPQPPVAAVPSAAADAPMDAAAGSGRSWSPWREPRTLIIGVVMLAVSMTEGAANDWVASAVVQGFGVTEATGIACLGVFLASMTTMRLVGTRLIDRFGRVTLLRLSGASALVGLTGFAFAPWLWLVVVSAAAWGFGAALGFPVGISAASDDPLRAARRTAVVSTIAYVAFLGGPPLLGLIANSLGFRHALAFILIPAVVALLLAGWTRPLPVATAGERA